MTESRPRAELRPDAHLYAQPPKPAAAELAEAAIPPGPDDLFERIRLGAGLGSSERKQVLDEVAWFSRNQDYLDRTFARARPYLYHILEEIERRGMPADLALLPLVESAFQPTAYSRSRAAGLWQFIPATGRRYGLKQTRWYDGRRDVAASTVAALDYLQDLHERFDGNWLHAIAAYNCGEGLVERRIRQNRQAGKPTDFWSLRLPRETSAYVPRMLAISMLVSEPERYGVRFQRIPNRAYWHAFDVGRQVDLAGAAEALGVSLNEMEILNPGLLRGVTDPGGPHRLLVPVSKATQMARLVNDLPGPALPAWHRAAGQHTVRRGETLGHIARRYATTVDALQRANGIQGSLIRVGQQLSVPGPAPRQQGQRVHTVQAGDTLWDLARSYNVAVEDLRAWNGLSARALLRPEQKLVVGAVEARPAETARATRGGTTTYEVRKGDSLWTIARSFNVRVNDLLQWNALTRSSLLQPGQQLIVRARPASI